MVTVGPRELAQARASSVLALDASSLSGLEVLSAEPAPAVGVVEVDGALAERAVATLCGYVDGYDALAARFALASEAGPVLLRVRSPGGDVAGLEQAVESMRRAKRGPVVAYVDELAASAAYWIAAAVADEIVAPPSGRVGSIGCIGVVVDESRALDAAGVRLEVVRSPAGKAEALSAAPLAELAEQRLRVSVEAAAGRFVAAVAAARGVAAADVVALDGAVLDGAAALRAGLVDHVGGRDVALARLAALEEQRTMDEQTRQTMAALGVADGAALAARVGELVALEAEVVRVTGERGSGAVGALVALAERARVGGEAVAALEAERAERQRREHAELVAQLEREGKLTPALRAWAGAQSAESLRAFGAVAPTLATQPHEEPAPGEVSMRLSSFEARVARQLGISEADYATTRREIQRGHRAQTGDE